MYSKAYVPSLVSRSENKFLANTASIFLGVLLLSLLAQVTIPLPWTPVAITGQTFGVALLSLMWGWKRGGTSMAFYLALGASGLPVFAQASHGFNGATVGYLVGMFLASIVVGHLADRGYAKTFKTALASAYVGSFLTLSCGVLGLSFFMPVDALLIAGVIPFLPGDLLKNCLAAYTASKINRI